VLKNIDEIPVSRVTERADADILSGSRVKWLGERS